MTGTVRDELLNVTMYRNLAHARIVITARAADHNIERTLAFCLGLPDPDYARNRHVTIARVRYLPIRLPPALDSECSQTVPPDAAPVILACAAPLACVVQLEAYRASFALRSRRAKKNPIM
ncbi:hypothetical protein [Tranquillimonas alkanivorans]|uniref:hypothetical protein n=1 Tax=Tranquillimonas alkanivorans TaxID=441119 RepID=UPI0015A5329B|nr:hypothetical protein [Tranquillimonas alkanivorans]